MAEQLPEVREADAPPEIAAIYDDIRHAIGIPLVNLIYRHFAAIPGALPWVWHVARQPIASGAIDGARARLVAMLELPVLESLNQGATGGMPLSGTALQAIDAVLDVYNRGNATNLIILQAVRRLLDGTTTKPSAPASESIPPEHSSRSIAAVPPLPRIGDLPPNVAELVRSLAAQHGGADANVIPSLYLHLAYWPGALRQIRDRLQPRFQDGSFQRAMLLTRTLAWEEAVKLSGGMSVESSPPSAAVPQIRHALEVFTTRVIPEMLLIGLAIQRALPRSETGSAE